MILLVGWLVGWVCDMVSFPRVSVSFKVFNTWDVFL